VDLQSDINGIELAVKIRRIDKSATIVFVTSHSELAPLVFKHKVEAMDYIVKDSPPLEIERDVISCITLAYQRFLDGKHSKDRFFTLKTGDQIYNILYDDILYFESSVSMRNKVLLHTINSIIEFRGYINDVSDLELPFFRCHQSFLININKIQNVDKTNREVHMINGEAIPIAIRKMTSLLKCMRAK